MILSVKKVNVGVRSIDLQLSKNMRAVKHDRNSC